MCVCVFRLQPAVEASMVRTADLVLVDSRRPALDTARSVLQEKCSFRFSQLCGSGLKVFLSLLVLSAWRDSVEMGRVSVR